MSDPSDTQRRRRSEPEATPELPSGYRSSRRGSKVAKRARTAVKVHSVRENLTEGARTVQDWVAHAVWIALKAGTYALAVFVTLAVVVYGVNGYARWRAERRAERQRSPEARAEAAKDNLLVIGVNGETATGFIALKVEPKEKRAWGIAIPAGAFMQIPGQGFERVGESYEMGAAASEAAVSNYLGVPFRKHLVVDDATYRATLEAQSVAELVSSAKSTNLSATEQQRLGGALASVPARDVGIVSLPVTPVTVGDQTYFQPQREKVADLLKTWWGVEVGPEATGTRVLIYNGAGTPGIAGKAAQDLIRHGYRVVDTRNADRFDYKTTEIVIEHGDRSVGEELKQALGGVGKVSFKESSQQVVDVIVILGSDYAPSSKDG